MLSHTADPNRRTDQGVPMSKLSEAEILERLPRAKNWERHGDMLVRTWQFPSFRRALEFINQRGGHCSKRQTIIRTSS